MSTGAVAAARAATPTHVHAVARLVVVVLGLAVAYRFTLGTLAADWNHETPLADLVLVPALAVVLLVAATSRHPYVAQLPLGRVDYLVAGVALAGAGFLLAAGPVLWSKYFWAMRIDVLTVPLVGAALVALLFGARALFPFAFPLAFLLLAWPLPYLALLEQALGAFTAGTASTVSAVAMPLHFARPVPGADGATFFVPHGGGGFTVQVASACAGVNGLVGYALLALAGVYFVRGRFLWKAAWLTTGAALVWTFNAARILAILGVGRAFGERAALEFLHPVAGLLALNASVLVLVKLRPRFRLTRRLFGDAAEVDSPLARTAPPERQATVPRVAVRFAVAVTATVALSLADGQLATAARGLRNEGLPAIRAFADAPRVGADWSTERVETIGWATPYFGRHSSWVRYRLRPRRDADRRGPFTIWLDAVSSPDLGALDSYTLAHCYSFHGFSVRLAQRVDLGNGVVGQAFVYETDRATWHAVAWEWPVRRATGAVEHERIVLLASTRTRPAGTRVRASSSLSRPVLDVLNTRAPSDDANAALGEALRGAAAEIVAARVAP